MMMTGKVLASASASAGRSIVGGVRPGFWTILSLLFRMVLYSCTQWVDANGEKVADIYWNSSNPIFRFDNEDHIFPVRILDSVDIICPKYEPIVPSDRTELSLIHMVDRSSYDLCTVDNKKAQVVGICSHPYTDAVITIFFREYTPNPNGLEFKAGREYFFISTSDGSKSGLMNDRDGLCRSYNMRLRFNVQPRKPDRISDTNDASNMLQYPVDNGGDTRWWDSAQLPSSTPYLPTNMGNEDRRKPPLFYPKDVDKQPVLLMPRGPPTGLDRSRYPADQPIVYGYRSADRDFDHLPPDGIVYGRRLINGGKRMATGGVCWTICCCLLCWWTTRRRLSVS